MLKTNSKKAKENIRELIRSYYENAEALQADLEAGKLPGMNQTQAAQYLVENGNFACYADDMRKEIKEALEETEEEAAKYTDDKVYSLYVYLLGREILNMIKE